MHTGDIRAWLLRNAKLIILVRDNQKISHLSQVADAICVNNLAFEPDCLFI
jgi:hypothetical protein